MKQGLRMRCRRITSGFLAFTMTAILVLGDAGAAFASTDGSKFYKDGSDLGGESSRGANCVFSSVSVICRNDEDRKQLIHYTICIKMNAVMYWKGGQL